MTRIAIQTEPIYRVPDIAPKLLGYTLHVPGPKWFQKLVHWAVGRWLVPNYETPKPNVSYRQIEVEYGRLAELCRHQIEWFIMKFGHEPKYLLVGPRQFYGVVDEIVSEFPMMISPCSWTPREFIGMSICIMPNFDGVLLLPDLEDLKVQ